MGLSLIGAARAPAQARTARPILPNYPDFCQGKETQPWP
jgi:hypothetical protein